MNRPSNTAFRQQRLKAWDCELTFTTFTALFIAVVAIFAPIGAKYIVDARGTTVLEIDYTACVASSPQVDLSSNDFVVDAGPDPSYVRSHFPSAQPASVKWAHGNNTLRYASGVELNTNNCVLDVTLPEKIPASVSFFYVLTGFSQNHRTYSTSFDSKQLLGQKSAAPTCNPLASDGGKPIYPCGLMANSMFNDTLREVRLLNAPGAADGTAVLGLSTSGLAWSSDRDLFKKSTYSNSDVVPPPAWRKRYPNNYTDDNPIPDVSQNDLFLTWMRAAGLSTMFAKPWAWNETASMEKATYRITIADEFPVDSWRGRKLLKIKGKDAWGSDGRETLGWICIALASFSLLTVICVHIYDRFLGGRERRLDLRTSWERDADMARGKQDSRRGL